MLLADRHGPANVIGYPTVWCRPKAKAASAAKIRASASASPASTYQQYEAASRPISLQSPGVGVLNSLGSSRTRSFMMAWSAYFVAAGRPDRQP